MILRTLSRVVLLSAFLAASQLPLHPAEYALPEKTEADRMLAGYFRSETAKISQQCMTEVKSLEDWNRVRGRYREELHEMLGLSPRPSKTDLKAVVTGRVEREDFSVENLHFQSSPGLYVTANLYLPKNTRQPAPTILYLSGHGPVISNNVSYGNKVSYQHHGAWFARNGYVCLVIDTLQLGEILGLHHGTYREGMWWWNARGYTPAGVEAWNCIRALDYLETRPEVDRTRFGATGRSGGGAYSWWIAALDDRIKAAAPVAGITDLQDHVINGCVEGHCDCMFMVNTYRWDYPQVAALVAPRPLLLVNTDADSIFPLDGVVRTHAQLRRIYDLHRASDKLGLVVAPGPHKDTQDLQVPVFRWFNQHLKNSDPIIEMAAVKHFAPPELKVFATLPTDAINTNIHDRFVPAAPTPELPKNREEWTRQRDEWLADLKAKSFASWPADDTPMKLEQKSTAIVTAGREGLYFDTYDLQSEPGATFRLFVQSVNRPSRPDVLSLKVLDESGFERLKAAWWPYAPGAFSNALTNTLKRSKAVDATDKQMAAEMAKAMKEHNIVYAFVAPRGVGITSPSVETRRLTQIRRRYMLLGETLDSAQVWDIRRALQFVREVHGRHNTTQVRLEGTRRMAVNVLYASLFEPPVARLILSSPPSSHRDGPDYLNVLRVLDVPQAMAMAAERSDVLIRGQAATAWEFPDGVARNLGWAKKRFEFEPLSAATEKSP